MSLAWQASEVISALGPAHHERLLQAGAAEELAILLQVWIVSLRVRIGLSPTSPTGVTFRHQPLKGYG